MKNRINKEMLVPGILYLFSVVNLLFMHYYIIVNYGAEKPLIYVDFIENLCGVTFDVAVLFFIFRLFAGRKNNRGGEILLCSYAVTLLWSFSNVVYSRFFGHYISFSAIGQIGSVGETFVLNSIWERLSAADFYYVFSLLFIIALVVSRRYALSVRLSRRAVLSILLLPVGIFVIDLFANAIHSYQILRPNTSYIAYYKFQIAQRHRYRVHSALYPVWANFIRGSVRILASDGLTDLFSSDDLQAGDIRHIEKEISDYSKRETPGRNRPDIDNVVFIIVESYLAVSSDMRVGGVEVTPNLNRLRHDKNVYYNGRMRSNIVSGESSDGQFIYMTGLLPLRSGITVSIANDRELPGLPAVLSRSQGKRLNKMIIPTGPTLWEQDKMCVAYGIDSLYSIADYGEMEKDALSDREVFDLAARTDEDTKGPFFSMILTISMHQPYDKPMDTECVIKSRSYPDNFNNYLTACHYTDGQIGKYLDNLKKKGLYDRSLIIITADHQAHIDLLEMSGKVSEDLPLYIVNGGIDSGTAWTGPCNQLDVYTTILDVLGIRNRWRGLGHTLLRKDYENSVTDEIESISDKIIRGDYFRRAEWK